MARRPSERNGASYREIARAPFGHKDVSRLWKVDMYISHFVFCFLKSPCSLLLGFECVKMGSPLS